jgi:hypothetical protein
MVRQIIVRLIFKEFGFVSAGLGARRVPDNDPSVVVRRQAQGH